MRWRNVECGSDGVWGFSSATQRFAAEGDLDFREHSRDIERCAGWFRGEFDCRFDLDTDATAEQVATLISLD